MSPRTFQLLAIVAVLVALGGGVAAGWLARGPGSSSSPGPSGPSGEPTPLSIVGAGSLNVVLPPIASAFANQTAGVSAPAAAQTYEGSIVALHAISQLHQSFDVALAADYRLIPQILETSYASYEVVFAADPVVLAYSTSASALNGINAGNWGTLIQSPGVVLGVSNASTDPLGYAAIFTLQLEGQLLNGSRTAVYSHFFSGAPGAFAVPITSATHLAPETQAATELSGGTVQAFLVYQSYARSAHLSSVPLSWQVNLGSYNASALSLYAQASTLISNGSGGTSTVTGAPVLFGATVPSNAPNAAEAQLFLAFLISPATAPSLTAAGFVPLPTAWTDRPSALPNALAGTTQALPASLAALIT